MFVICSHCCNDNGLLICTMGGIGQNLQLQFDVSEIVYAINRAPHKTYVYQICDKICHIVRVMGQNECARHYKSGFIYNLYLDSNSIV